MALITDPDDLSQGIETAVTDAVFTGSSGANTTITSAGSNLPSLSLNSFFEVRDHSTAGNNGLYIATGSPSASSVSCTKVDGPDPADAASEAIRTLGDDSASPVGNIKSIHIDTLQKRIYLLEQGELSTDGVTGQAKYSFLKEEWKLDPDLIQNSFPMVSITPEQFEYINGWEPRDVVSPAIQTKKLIRTAGWDEVASDGVLTRRYFGAISLGAFEDTVNDLAYYQLGNDPTDTGAAVDFTFAGPVNEAVLVYEDIGVLGNLAITGTDTITRNDSPGSFLADGFAVGGQVTITDSEDPTNDGTFVITAVSALSMTVSGTLTNNADDDTMRLAVNNTNAVTLRLRIRDGDTNGKTFDAANLADIGFSEVDNKAFRFPLANATDLQITATDAAIAGSPWSEVRLRYLPETYNREVDSTTKRNFGIVIDVGTYSRGNGVSNGTVLFTSADHILGAGEDLSDYANGTLIIHEGTDQGQHAISGTPVDNAGTLEITLSSALTGSETDLSFTMERAAPLTADQNEIYEKVQFQLRQDADIDATNGVVTGRTADELISFVASNDVRFGAVFPTNPNGGGSGVIVEGFDTNDTNNFSFVDNGGVSRTFPFVAAGSITFNDNLLSDSDPEYWMFFEYTTRTNLTDGAVVGPAGDTYDLESPGANLPALSVNDYIAISGFANEDNNGLFVVTVVNTINQDYTVRRIDGASVGVAEAGVTIDVDQNPIDTPDAIIVDNNSGVDITGPATVSPTSFDFDYDNNVQGGRTAATDANIRIRAIGLETGQFAEVSGTITRSTGLTFSVVAALERNYSNP